MANKLKRPLKAALELYQASLSRMIFTESEARKEYNRLRRAANARLATLQRRGLGDVAALKSYPKEFKSAAGESESAVRKRLAQVAHFMSLQTTTYKGIMAARNKSIETMREHGYDFINKSNIDSFGRFMEAAKRHYGNKKGFDSEQVVEAFWEHLEELEGITDADGMEDLFNDWLEDEGEWEEIEPEPEEYVEPEPVRPKREERERRGKTKRERREAKREARRQRERKANSKKAKKRRRK